MEPVRIERFYLGCLAHASYAVGSEGVAAIIDPQRDVDIYLEAATRNGWKFEHIIETHLHADFVSGHRELAVQDDMGSGNPAACRGDSRSSAHSESGRDGSTSGWPKRNGQSIAVGRHFNGVAGYPSAPSATIGYVDRRGRANYPDFRGKLAAQTRGSFSADAHQQRSVARSRLHCQAGSGHQSHSFHFAQCVWIAVRNAADHGGHVTGPFGKGDFFAFRDRSVFFGDDMAVRIGFRIA
jgi:hypothetical protein